MTVLLGDDKLYNLNEYVKRWCPDLAINPTCDTIGYNDRIIVATSKFQAKIERKSHYEIVEQALYLNIPIYLAYSKMDGTSNIYHCKPDSILVNTLNGISGTGIEISQFFKKQLEFIQIDLI
jgi:hypothetical protein